jgi:hypothetical protein
MFTRLNIWKNEELTLIDDGPYGISPATSLNEPLVSACHLEVDLEKLNRFFRRWRLQPNPNQTEACKFHLNNQEAYTTMKIKFFETLVQHADHPKYLGVTLDRSLT